jgi:hypothetical protein
MPTLYPAGPFLVSNLIHDSYTGEVEKRSG